VIFDWSTSTSLDSTHFLNEKICEITEEPILIFVIFNHEQQPIKKLIETLTQTWFVSEKNRSKNLKFDVISLIGLIIL